MNAREHDRRRRTRLKEREGEENRQRKGKDTLIFPEEECRLGQTVSPLDASKGKSFADRLVISRNGWRL